MCDLIQNPTNPLLSLNYKNVQLNNTNTFFGLIILVVLDKGIVSKKNFDHYFYYNMYKSLINI